MLSRVGKTRPDQGRGVLLARIVGKAGSKQGYPVGKNCGKDRIRTGVHSGQELLTRQDQNRGTHSQWTRTVGKKLLEQGYTVDKK